MSQAEIIVNEARTWIGTPFHHQASLKGVGSGCLGVIRGVWWHLFGSDPQEIPPYTQAWDEIAKADAMLGSFAHHLILVDSSAPQLGDIIVFRMRPNTIAKHCAILTAPNSFVHSYDPVGVVESNLTASWQRRIVARFRFPQRSHT